MATIAIVRVSYSAQTKRWDVQHMLRMARAHRNGGTFFVAKSKRTVRDLERLFRSREVASLLEDAVGALWGDFGLTEKGIVHVELRYDTPRDLDDIMLCLAEMGVEVVDVLPERAALEVLNE